MMMQKLAIKLIPACGLLVQANDLFAHDGHGLTGAHWHATDVLGFIAVGALIGVAIWFSRGGD
jgi:hypothetical protein